MLQCVAVASETRELRLWAMSLFIECARIAVGGGSGGQEAHGRRGEGRRVGFGCAVVVAAQE